MIQPKKYLPVRGGIFYTPLIKENLRLDFLSAEYKLNDLPLLTALMLRDGKTTHDIAAVTLLPLAVIEDIFAELNNQAIFDGGKLTENAKKILELSDCINGFNLNAPPIFFDTLTKSLVILHGSVKLEKFPDNANCTAVVKNSEQISIADFKDVSNFIKGFLIARGAGELIDNLKILRPNHSAEIFFAAREIRYLPVVGEGNFKGCVNFDSSRTFDAELPVRRFKIGDRNLNVDLLLGTIFETANDEEPDTEEAVLSFRARPEIEREPLKPENLSVFSNVVDMGTRYIKISVAKEVVGDFL